jgi:hypothetical protein
MPEITVNQFSVPKTGKRDRKYPKFYADLLKDGKALVNNKRKTYGLCLDDYHIDDQSARAQWAQVKMALDENRSWCLHSSIRKNLADGKEYLVIFWED